MFETPMARLSMRVARREMVARDIVQLDLIPVDGALLPATTPGAHVTLDLPGGLRRSYSLVDCGPRPECYRIAVARDPASRGGSAAIHAGLPVGAVVTVSMPRNDFPLAVDAPRSLLFAGGIGVTPIQAMARHLADQGRDLSVHLAVRSRDRAAYVAALAACDPGFVLHVDDEAGGPLDLRSLIAQEPPGTHFYCCGPAPMLAAFVAATASVPPAQVHLERFSAGAAPAGGDSFALYLQRSGITATVNAGQSILEVLQGCGIEVESSCQDGVCGTCETRVLSGAVDHRDAILTDAEKAAGRTMMVCVSRCRGERLVLDL